MLPVRSTEKMTSTFGGRLKTPPVQSTAAAELISWKDCPRIALPLESEAATMHCFTVTARRDGSLAITSPARPVTCGAAIEVPLLVPNWSEQNHHRNEQECPTVL